MHVFKISFRVPTDLCVVCFVWGGWLKGTKGTKGQFKMTFFEKLLKTTLQKVILVLLFGARRWGIGGDLFVGGDTYFGHVDFTRVQRITYLTSNGTGTTFLDSAQVQFQVFVDPIQDGFSSNKERTLHHTDIVARGTHVFFVAWGGEKG